MYKILNSRGLGVAGKQNELIELALTYKFNGVEVDINDLVGRHDALGKQFAIQFLQSAKIDMGTFCLPAKLGGTEDEFTTSIASLETIVDLADTLNAKCCYIQIEPKSKTLTFQENFEQHQTRLQQIGEVLEPHGIKLGVSLQASQVNKTAGDYKFIQTAEEILTLAKTVGQSNVGLCLDTWEWVVGGGALDQLAELDPGAITELRLADLAPDADPASIDRNKRTRFPGQLMDSFSVKAAQQLIKAGYDGPISVSTAVSTFSEGSRESVVDQLSKHLDMIIAGEHPAKVAAAEAAAKQAAEEEESEDVVAAGSQDN